MREYHGFDLDWCETIIDFKDVVLQLSPKVLRDTMPSREGTSSWEAMLLMQPPSKLWTASYDSRMVDKFGYPEEHIEESLYDKQELIGTVTIGQAMHSLEQKAEERQCSIHWGNTTLKFWASINTYKATIEEMELYSERALVAEDGVGKYGYG
jgi:hypothetical protein